jgi:glycosyltransferase involved in cell wall biosynthesis
MEVSMIDSAQAVFKAHHADSITLCICTMNRPEDLARCLSSIALCDRQPDEILISDDSPDPQMNAEVRQRYPDCRYQAGPKRGLAANRNACILAAQGTHIMFIDDDVMVSPDFFEVAYRRIAETGPSTIVTGYEIKHEQGTKHKVSPLNADFWGLQKLPVRDQYRSIVINATVFPKSLFQIAKFDEFLRYGSEEIDIAQHAIAVGYQIQAVDDLYLNHYPSPINRDKYRQFLDASRLYATAKGYWEYEQSIGKVIIFVLLAPLQLLVYTIKRGQFTETKQALKAIRLACSYGYGYFKSKHSHVSQTL